MKRVLVFAAAVALSTGAHAADKPLAVMGYSQERVPGATCRVDMAIDQDEFIKAIPLMKSMGMLNPDFVTQTRINLMPMTLTMTWALEMAPETIKAVFEDDTKIKTCDFKQFVEKDDDMGRSIKMPMFWFKVTRDLYSKINWDKFQSYNIPKVMLGFAANPEFTGELAVERQADQQPP